MDDKIRKILERPFEQEVLKQRQGPNNKTFTYVEVQLYIDRLNLAFNGGWSFEVTRREQVDDQLLVEGRFTAGGIVKTGLGGATITRRRDGGQMISLADDYKKAEADALKRCCRLLGIGGHLYASDGDEDVEPAQHPNAPRTAAAPARTTAAPRTAPAATTSPAAKNEIPERNRLTSKQLNAALSIVRSRNIDERQFRDQVRTRYGKQIEYLTRAQASEVIGDLTGNGHDRQPAEAD